MNAGMDRIATAVKTAQGGTELNTLLKRNREALEKNTDKTCKRCGNCCRTFLFAYITDEDMVRWKQEGREDILHILKNAAPVWAGDRLISSRTGQPLISCPFLTWDGTLTTCTIHETRPRVCREYIPGSNELCPQFSRRPSQEET